MAGFGLPNFGQLTEAFRKAQQIQQDAQVLQQELDAMDIEGKSGDGRASGPDQQKIDKNLRGSC